MTIQTFMVKFTETLSAFKIVYQKTILGLCCKL